MKITIYKSKVNPDLGFSIQEDFGNKYDPQTKQLKRTKDKIFTLWIDEFEGGEANKIIDYFALNPKEHPFEMRLRCCIPTSQNYYFIRPL